MRMQKERYGKRVASSFDQTRFTKLLVEAKQKEVKWRKDGITGRPAAGEKR